MDYFYGVHMLIKLQNYRGKTVRIMSNSEYLAHSEPLKLLKIEDVYKLKLMRFYYITYYPSYFNFYLEVIKNAFSCQYKLRQIDCPLIRPQRT